MLIPLRDRSRQFRSSVTAALAAIAVLALAFYLGLRASAAWLGLLTLIVLELVLGRP